MYSEKDTAHTPVRDIVVLGGSYGGVSVAHNVLKHTLPQLQQHGRYRVLLVSPSSEILCRPACPRAMISDDLLDQKKLFVSIEKAFEQYPREHFSYIHGAATSLDSDRRTVTVRYVSGELKVIDFHGVVIATGASTHSPLLGLNRDSSALRESWAWFRKGLTSAEHIVVAGGGPTGIEVAGELGEYLNGRAGWFASRLERPKVRITVVTSGSDILPVLRPAIAEKAEAMLAKVGVTVMKNTRVVSISPDDAGTGTALMSNATVHLSNGEVIDADLYIPATGTIPNTSFLPGSLLDASKRIETNASTLRVDKAGARVYAVGDASSYARPAVHNILDAVPVLCKSLTYDLLLEVSGNVTLSINRKTFSADDRETQLVPIGGKGVGSAMGWRLPSWAVWLIKGRDYWLWTTPKLWSGKQWEKEQ